MKSRKCDHLVAAVPLCGKFDLRRLSQVSPNMDHLESLLWNWFKRCPDCGKSLHVSVGRLRKKIFARAALQMARGIPPLSPWTGILRAGEFPQGLGRVARAVRR